MNVLEIQGLHKSFGDKKVLKGVDLCVPQGAIYGFIGKNGSGKTTTMKTVLGLIPLDAGSINVMEEGVKYGETPTNKYVGYLPDVPSFYSFMTAGEYLDFCGKISGMSAHAIKQRREELLCLVGLEGEKHRIKGFSRGMKQRLGIAAALFGDPKLLICDEPTSALDPLGRREILDILLSIKDRTTVLFSTHILADVERICTDVAFLEDGVIAMQGKVSDIKSEYRSDKYCIVLENLQDAKGLCREFKGAELGEGGTVFISERVSSIYEIMGYLSSHSIPTLKIEKLEPTLESLFMEVTEK